MGLDRGVFGLAAVLATGRGIGLIVCGAGGRLLSILAIIVVIGGQTIFIARISRGRSIRQFIAGRPPGPIGRDAVRSLICGFLSLE